MMRSAFLVTTCLLFVVLPITLSAFWDPFSQQLLTDFLLVTWLCIVACLGFSVWSKERNSTELFTFVSFLLLSVPSLLIQRTLESRRIEAAFTYPKLIRPALEAHYAQHGTYPEKLQDLTNYAELPPLPAWLCPPTGIYSGGTDQFCFEIDWSLLGPLGAFYCSKEDRWRHYS